MRNELNGHARTAERVPVPGAPPKQRKKKAAPVTAAPEPVPVAEPAAAPKAKRTRAPKVGPDERAVAARRIFAAQLGRREAEAEWTGALALGVGLGVIPDTGTAPEPVGTSRVVYADPGLQIVLQVAAPIAGVNVPAFKLALIKAGVAAKLVDRLAAKHATETKPAHKFVCTPL